MAVNDFRRPLTDIGPGLCVGGLNDAREIDGVRLKGNAAFGHLLAAAVNFAGLDAHHAG